MQGVTSWIVKPYDGAAIAPITVPGDKSISHRSVMFNALAVLSSGDLLAGADIRGLLEAEDVLRTTAACNELGPWVDKEDGEWFVGFRPVSPHIINGERVFVRPPESPIDCGNSGTTARLLLGALAGLRDGDDVVRRPYTLHGDASLSRRPMRRVLAPLTAMGAQFSPADAAILPITVTPARLHGIDWTATVASAQVKSAVLLAGLNADSPTIYREPTPSRDHTERMFRAMGADLQTTRWAEGAELRLGPGALRPVNVDVPGDISSAAFWLVAACILGIRLTIRGVGVNPTRTGVIDVLRAMGASIEVDGAADDGVGEPIAHVTVTGGALSGTVIGGSLIPRLIDEIPVLAIAAAFAVGETVIRDAAELRVKESDRIAVVVHGLREMGVEVDDLPDGMRIRGRGGEGLRLACVSSHGDHRIAMAFGVAGLRVGAQIQDVACVATSYPGFFEQLRALSPRSAASRAGL